jgi:hypothetical protein
MNSSTHQAAMAKLPNIDNHLGGANRQHAKDHLEL